MNPYTLTSVRIEFVGESSALVMIYTNVAGKVMIRTMPL